MVPHVGKAITKKIGESELEQLKVLFSDGNPGGCLRTKPISTKYAEAINVKRKELLLLVHLRNLLSGDESAFGPLCEIVIEVEKYTTGGNGQKKPKDVPALLERIRNLQTTGIAAQDHLRKANLRLVVNIARSYKKDDKLPFPDRIAFGNMGLVRAIETYDPDFLSDSNNKFSTYATRWVKQTIRRAVEDENVIHVPTYLMNTLSNKQRDVMMETGNMPSLEEAAHMLSVPNKKFAHLLKAIKASKVDQASGGITDDEGNGDYDASGWAVDEKPTDIPGELIRTESLSRMHEAIKGLDDREQLIIRMRHGLGEYEPSTLKEVGYAVGLTRERVRQIEAEALGKLAIEVDPDYGSEDI